MELGSQPETVWVAVKVERGIPTEAKVFTNLNAAKEWERKVRAHIDAENDETGIFPCRIDSASLVSR